MEFVIISACAEGYYSGQTYTEEVPVSREFFNKYEDKLRNMSLYIGELDGKHSEVECDIDFEFLEEGEFKDLIQDSDNLYWEILQPIEEDDINRFKEDINKYNAAKIQFEKQSPTIKITVELKEYQKEGFMKYCTNNGINIIE